LKRRTFLKFAAFAVFYNPLESLAVVPHIRVAKEKKNFRQLKAYRLELLDKSPQVKEDRHIRDYLSKIRHPDRPNKNDIILDSGQFQLLQAVVEKFTLVQAIIGHGNFSILGFEDVLRISNQYSEIGKLTPRELEFLEMLYYRDAREYGFNGKKLIDTMTHAINKRDLQKTPYNGSYLFRGKSVEKFARVKKDLGEDLVLTSGIRGLTKQFFLFMHKSYRHGGNLSLASRSLAPPGYSYHATGDFDVGQKGFGSGNFTEKFTSTYVYKKLAIKGFVNCRYDRDNMLGVRYEPWHIKL